MKRSNRLVLLIGIFLALVAFVLILLTLSQGPTGSGGATPVPTTINVVVATKDIPLGAKITADAVGTKEIAIGDKPVDSFTDTAFVIGQIARADVTAGQLITNAIINGTSGQIKNISVPAGHVAIAVQVDQVTGVGTIIRAGDYVDLVTGITGKDNVPLVVFVTPAPRASVQPAFNEGGLPYNTTTVKTVIQGIQVLGTLLPPPSQTAAAGTTPAPNSNATTLNGQQEMVILAVTPQQVEVIKFSQMSGNISLVLRSSSDCQPPVASPSPGASTEPGASPSPTVAPSTGPACPIIPTTGITLRRMVDDFGVLPPQIVEVIEPTPYPRP